MALQGIPVQTLLGCRLQAEEGNDAAGYAKR